MACQSRGTEAPVAGLRCGIHADIALLRVGNVADATDHLSRAAGVDRRRASTAGAGDPAGNISQRAAWARDGSVRDRDSTGADSWPYSRRMDHRQLQLALDFLSQSSGGDTFALSH